MNKNLIPNQFDYAGIYVEGQRSSFPFKKGVIDSFMSGMLVPLGDPIRVIPGTKLDLNINAMIRSNTMTAVPLDPMFIDFFAVWVPDRIVWTHQPQFLGENDTTAWTQSTSYSYPSVTYRSLTNVLRVVCNNGSVADGSTTMGNIFLSPHYGLFTNTDITNLPVKDVDINVLSYRGYYMSWNTLFRDENYQRPVLFSKTDTGSSGEFGYLLQDYLVANNVGVLTPLNSAAGTSWSVGSGLSEFGACLMPVNKFHDVFTSVLPQPQFGAGVSLPLGTSADVYWTAPGTVTGTTNLNAYGPTAGASTAKTFTIGSLTAGAATLKADLSTATAATINQLRSSVMYQRYLEALARAGRRVPEFYEAIYNVKNTSAACDYPKLLTRARYVLGVNQVVATADGSGSGWTSHLGDTGAYSLTQLRNIPCCEQDFSEFGYLHLFYCVRAANRYSQIIQEHFTHKVLLDEYNPYFDHIGDVAVPNHLVNVVASAAHNFGYAEAWWSERTQISMANGALNKAYGSLKYWTLGEVFGGSVQTCTPSFLTFDPATLDDIFVSKYYTYPQFIIDALIHGKKVVRMSQHSIPGIVGRI